MYHKYVRWALVIILLNIKQHVIIIVINNIMRNEYFRTDPEDNDGK